MKYAKFSDAFLSDFRLDDNGETLVLTDKRGYTREIKLLSYEERPQGEWVPVSERLPKIGVQVLCCNEFGSVFTSAITYISESGRAKFGKHYGVIAWKHLPKPYESEGKQ